MLVVGGESDLRTPHSSAVEAHRLFKGSQLLVVPNVGHSGVAGDPTPCARHAVQRFLLGGQAGKCRDRGDPYAPRRLAPTALKQVSSAAGVSNRRGRVLHAVAMTVQKYGGLTTLVNNAAPTDQHWIVQPSAQGRVMLPAIWGFRGRDQALVINVRSETVEKRFREAFSRYRVVVPADGLLAAFPGRWLCVRRAAELAAPDDERVVQEAAALQVGQERGRGPVAVGA